MDKMMPKPPDFEQIARIIIGQLRDEEGPAPQPYVTDVAEQLRQVWNARGAADRAVIDLAERVVGRVLSVYRDDYIERMDREEPDSLLGLVKQLDRALRMVDY